MRKRRIHLYDLGGTFSLACYGKGVGGEYFNAIHTKDKTKVTCPKCLKAVANRK